MPPSPAIAVGVSGPAEGDPRCALMDAEPKKKERGRACRLRGGLAPRQWRQTRPRKPLTPIGGYGAPERRAQEADKANGGEEPEKPRQPKSDDETSKRFCNRQCSREKTNYARAQHTGKAVAPRHSDGGSSIPP